MLLREATFTVELGEHGYLIGFDDDCRFPAEMPFSSALHRNRTQERGRGTSK